MHLDPVTLDDRIDFVLGCVVLAVVITLAGLLLLRVIGGSSENHRIRGPRVLFWTVIGLLAGGVYGACLIDNVRYYQREADGGMAGFGFLIGWAVGMIHGSVAVALRRRRGPKPDGEQDATP